MRWIILAALMLTPVVASAYSTPMVEDDRAPVRQCEIDGVMVYQRGACPEGSHVKGWNLPVAQAPAPEMATQAGEAQGISVEPTQEQAREITTYAMLNISRPTPVLPRPASGVVEEALLAPRLQSGAVLHIQGLHYSEGSVWFRVSAKPQGKRLVSDGWVIDNALTGQPGTVPLLDWARARIDPETMDMITSGQFPEFDSGAYCNEFREIIGGSSEGVFDRCMENEQDERQALQSIYSDLSYIPRVNCMHAALNDSPTTGSYQVFNQCLGLQEILSGDELTFM